MRNTATDAVVGFSSKLLRMEYNIRTRIVRLLLLMFFLRAADK